MLRMWMYVLYINTRREMEQMREGDCDGEKWANILNWVKCEWHTHLIFLMESKQMMMTQCCTVDVWNYQKLGIIFRFALIQILLIQLIPARKKGHNGKGLAWFADVTGIAFRAVIYLFILLLFLTILLSFFSNFPSSAQWKHCAGKSTPANKRPLALFWGLFFVFPCKWTPHKWPSTFKSYSLIFTVTEIKGFHNVLKN